MTNRVSLIVFAAVMLLAGGLFALYLPVFIDAFDQFGWQVKCGNGFTTELTQASSAAGAAHNYVERCESALMARRLWAIPTAALGGVTLTWQAAAAVAHDHRRPAPSAHRTQSSRWPNAASRQDEMPC